MTNFNLRTSSHPHAARADLVGIADNLDRGQAPPLLRRRPGKSNSILRAVASILMMAIEFKRRVGLSTSVREKRVDNVDYDNSHQNEYPWKFERPLSMFSG
jgi:hypothetical protein